MSTVRTSKNVLNFCNLSWKPRKTSYSTVISNAANKVIWLNNWSTMLKKVNMGRTRFMGLQKQAKKETIDCLEGEESSDALGQF